MYQRLLGIGYVAGQRSERACGSLHVTVRGGTPIGAVWHHNIISPHFLRKCRERLANIAKFKVLEKCGIMCFDYKWLACHE